MVQMLVIEAITDARARKFSDSERNLDQAGRFCTAAAVLNCGTVTRARGILEMERGNPRNAARLFGQSLVLARTRGDQFLEATALLNLGAAALKEEHFDEMIGWLEPALDLSTRIKAESIAVKAVGNLGWAYYNLGDFDQALELSRQAERRAVQIGAVRDQLAWITNSGYVYAVRGDFSQAKTSYLQAYGLAKETDSKEHIYNALRALALVSVESGDLDEARRYSDDAIVWSLGDNKGQDELYPLLVKGLVAAQMHNLAQAEQIFRGVERDPNGNASLKWRSEHALASLYQDEHHPDAADREYRAALATFEAARPSRKRDDTSLPFSANATRIYDDYIHFLVAQGRTADALQWADYSRARTLAEGLGALKSEPTKGPRNSPPRLNVQQIAQHAGGTLLFYWLGEKQSFLWVITEKKTSLFPLPASSVIETTVERYHQALANGPEDVLESANNDGLALYQMLIEPARALLPKDAKVFILPDGALNKLNFETLLVAKPQLHCWIEDVTLATASSLRMLGASLSGVATSKNAKPSNNLLLIGNNVPPNDKYPSLPRAAAQMETVARHFAPERRQIFTQAAAAPQAYLNGNPEQFSMIHFVAHGVASRLSPLDSAIVLSKSGTANDSFKLYARDIVAHPLRAELVTVSACYSADGRSYSGEGLVGLSWAFLRAGARNVVAALWQVTDVATEPLMTRFYDELDRGASPEAALRSAKLTLLRGKQFHNPYYWASLQLYTQGRSGEASSQGAHPAQNRHAGQSQLIAPIHQ